MDLQLTAQFLVTSSTASVLVWLQNEFITASDSFTGDASSGLLLHPQLMLDSAVPIFALQTTPDTRPSLPLPAVTFLPPSCCMFGLLCHTVA